MGHTMQSNLLQHGPTNPLSPQPPAPWGLAGWLEGDDKSEKWSANKIYYAIKLLQHGPTNPLSPQPPPPWGLAGWLGGDDKSEKWSAS